MIVLGIDPGTRHLGWGVLRVEGTRMLHVTHGVVDTDETASVAERLCAIERALLEILEAHRPTAAAVESVFFARDAMAASKLGHARGVVLLVLARAGIPIAEYEPARVKRAVVGHGRAEKKQIALTVAALLGLPEPPRSDASDALAIALVHARSAPMLAHIARVEAAIAANRERLKAVRPPGRRASFVRGSGPQR